MLTYFIPITSRKLGDGGEVPSALSDEDVEKIVRKTDGYSGSDMRHLTHEACQVRVGGLST